MEIVRFTAEYKNQKFERIYRAIDLTEPQLFGAMLEIIQRLYLPSVPLTDITFTIRPDKTTTEAFAEIAEKQNQ